MERHEIEAWVNPSAWDDQDEAEQVCDEIEALRIDDERAWVAVVARHDVERVQRRLAAVEAERDAVLSERAHLLRGLHADHGISMYRLAQWAGLSNRQAQRIIRGAGSRRRACPTGSCGNPHVRPR
ncbi:MAG: hypothetical protein KBF43_05565 [Dermatophilaceae bacterium]|nr:hypothetical protein [Dermatophilaceae bacterium]